MTIIRSILAASLIAIASPAFADHHEAAALEAALASADRPAEDKSRDAGRRPAQVLAFLGIGRGMTVMDVIAAGGYYTEVLSVAVGEEGTVYAQNPAAVLKFRDGANDQALTARLADDRLPNVIRWDHEIDALDLAPGSLDAAITALNLHDLYNRDPAIAVGMLRAIRGLLKPGGVFGIIDHAGDAGAPNADLHRMQKAQALEAAQAAGFDVAGDSDLLANPSDNHSQMVFAPEVRGKTDRFLLKLVNPG